MGISLEIIITVIRKINYKKICPISKGIGLIFFILFFYFEVHSQELSDTVFTDLEEIEVTGFNKNPLQYIDGSNMRLNMNELINARRAFGEADVINLIKNLAGVTTAGDYGAGLMIDGMDGSQILYRVADAPIFYPYRFGGMFSIFNSPHFSRVSFERGVHDASMPSRLGAKLDFYPYSNVGIKFGGVVNIGLLSSSATLKIPLGKKLAAIVSGRISYVDQVYGKWLHYGTTGIQYNFNDINVSLNYDINDLHSLNLNLFYSSDHLNYDDSNFDMDMKIEWMNAMSTIGWNYNGKYCMRHRIYWSGFDNVLKCGLPQFQISAPSYIRTLGVSGDFEFDIPAKDVIVKSGYELSGYSNSLQDIESLEMTDHIDRYKNDTYHPFEARMFANLNKRFSQLAELDFGLSASGFHNSDGYSKITVDPRLTFRLHTQLGMIGLHGGTYTQFLHNIGFSDIGLASNFWMSSNKTVGAQTAYAMEFEYLHRFDGIGLTLNSNIYYRCLFNQPEYFGQLTDLLNSNYDCQKYIMVGKGYNCGINITMSESQGPLFASLSVGYGFARRHFPGFKKSVRAASDPGLTINASFSYSLGKHWDISANFVYSEGRLYTPPKSLYIISGNVITDYGLPNSARLPQYHRLDLSATWHKYGCIGNHRIKHLVNLSMINAYGHRNVDFRKYRINSDEMSICIVDMHSLYRFLPSLSYTIEF